MGHCCHRKLSGGGTCRATAGRPKYTDIHTEEEKDANKIGVTQVLLYIYTSQKETIINKLNISILCVKVPISYSMTLLSPLWLNWNETRWFDLFFVVLRANGCDDSRGVFTHDLPNDFENRKKPTTADEKRGRSLWRSFTASWWTQRNRVE